MEGEFFLVEKYHHQLLDFFSYLEVFVFFSSGIKKTREANMIKTKV